MTCQLTIAFVIVLLTLLGDLVLILLMTKDRIPKIERLGTLILLCHIPFWAASLYIGLHYQVQPFAIPVRIVQ